MCHTGILHQVAHLDGIIVFHRCSSLVLSALKCELQLVREVFVASSQLIYTTLGYKPLSTQRYAAACYIGSVLEWLGRPYENLEKC